MHGMVIPYMHSIRARLVAQVLAVALPLIALIAYDYANRLESRIALAGNSAQQLAASVAASLTQLIDNERAMLAALAVRPAQRVERPAVCDPLIAQALELNPYRANVAVFTATGEPVCSALPLPPAPSAALTPVDQDYAQRLLRTGSFSMGEPFKGRITGRWLVPLVFPRRDASKRLIGWVGAPLDVQRIGDLLAPGASGGRDVIAVISPQGRIVSRSVDALRWVGTDVRSQPMAAAMLAGSLDGWQGPGLDGIDRIWRVADVPLAGWKVLVGLDQARLLAPTNAALTRNTVVTALLLLLVGAVATRIGRAIVRPIQAQARVLARITAGERALRAPLTGVVELDQISLEMNHMLDTLALAEAERAQAVAASDEADEKLRLFIHFAPAAIAMFDSEMRYLAFSQRWITDYGLQDQDITGRAHYELVPNLPPRWKAAHQRCLAGATESEEEDAFPRDDGSVDWVRWAVHPWRTAGGAVGGIILFSEVITERKRLVQKLRDSENLFRTLVKSSSQSIWNYRPGGAPITQIDQGNAAWWCAFTGQTEQQRTAHDGLGWLNVVHPQDREQARHTWLHIVSASEPTTASYRVRRADGDWRWLKVHGVPIRDERGVIQEWAGTVTDITERQQAEQSLAENRRTLEALTRRLLDVQETERRMIARELHDEVGGVLTAVKLNLQALRRAHSDAQREAALVDGLALVEGAIGSVRSLSLDLRPAMLDDLGLIPALKWYCERQAQRAGVVIDLALDAIDLKAAVQLESACFRIVQEALTNAVRHAQAQRIEVALRRDDGHFVLEISDDGVGFDAPAARARGLAGESGGLLGMAERVGLLGGRFVVETEPGGGTRVWVEFAMPEGGFS